MNLLQIKNTTNVTVQGHRFTVMHASALISAGGLGAVFVGDHPGDILMLLHTTTIRRIVAAVIAVTAAEVAAEAAALNPPDPDDDPSDLALFDSTEARAINKARSA